jgi:hypothetical protein
MNEVTSHRRRAGVPAEEDPVPSEPSVHHLVRFGRVERFTKARQLVFDERIHWIEHESAERFRPIHMFAIPMEREL